MHAGRDRSAAAGWKAVVIKPAGSINHNAARSHTGTMNYTSGLFRTQEIIGSPISREHRSASFKNKQLFSLKKRMVSNFYDCGLTFLRLNSSHVKKWGFVESSWTVNILPAVDGSLNEPKSKKSFISGQTDDVTAGRLSETKTQRESLWSSHLWQFGNARVFQKKYLN